MNVRARLPTRGGAEGSLHFNGKVCVDWFVILLGEINFHCRYRQVSLFQGLEAFVNVYHMICLCT